MTDNNELKLHDLVPDQQIANGLPIKATATASQDGNPPNPPVEVVFELPKGSGALFKKNNKPTIQCKTDASTGDVGPVYFYSHKPIANGQLKANWTTDKNAHDKKNFKFTPAPPGYDLRFTTPAPSNNQPANGFSTNVGQVVVTNNGDPLPEGESALVMFTLSGKTAKFDPGKELLFAGSVALVTTYKNSKGQDVADAFFTDTTAEKVTLTAWLPAHSDATKKTQDFAFDQVAAVGYEIALKSLTPDDSMPADGKAENAARALVTYNGDPLGENATVTFTLSSDMAKFDLHKPSGITGTPNEVQVETHKDEKGHDIADVYFTDTKPETVILTASLQNHGVSTTEDFTFETLNPDGYELTLKSLTPDGAPANGVAENGCQAVVTLNDGALSKDEIIHVIFTLSSGTAKFYRTEPWGIWSSDSQVVVPTRKDENGRGVANVYFTDAAIEPVTVTASLQHHVNDPSKTQNFTFTRVRYKNTINLLQLVNWAKGDGSAQNRVMACVLNARGELETSYSGKVVFTLKDKAASFVGSSEVDAIGGLAVANFVCSNPDDMLPKGVKVYVDLQDGSAEEASLDFGFTGRKFIPTTFLEVGDDGLSDSSNPKSYGSAFLGLDILDWVTPQTMCVSISLENSAYFPDDQPQTSVVLNPKCLLVPVYFQWGDGLELTFCIADTNPNGEPETIDFATSLINTPIVDPGEQTVTLPPAKQTTNS